MAGDSKLPIELNIRGVGGATAREILGVATEHQVKPVQVDDEVGFYRLTDDPNDDRHREAYDWGRLTSGGAAHSVWWVLLPFTLLNVAGWMFRPVESDSDHETARPFRSTLWWGRLLIVVAGLVLTSLYVMWIGVIALEMIAIECGGTKSCFEPWYFAPLTWFGGSLGWRIGLGLFLTAAVVLLLLIFIVSTQSKLEGWEHDKAHRAQDDPKDRARYRLRRNTDLDDMGFWYKWEEYRRLLRWHLATVMVTLGGLGGYAFSRLGDDLDFNGWAWLGFGVLIGLVVAALYRVTAPEERNADEDETSSYTTVWTKRLKWTLTHLAIGIAAGVGIHAADLGNDEQVLNLAAAIRSISTGVFFLGMVLWFVILIRYLGDHELADIRHRFCVNLRPFIPRLKCREDGARELGFRWAGPVVAGALALYIMGAGFGALTHVIGLGVIGSDAVADSRFNTSLVDTLALALVGFVAVVLTAYFRGRNNDQGVLDDYWPPEGDPSCEERKETHEDDPTRKAREDVLTDRERAWRVKVKRRRFLAKTGGEADRILWLLIIIIMVLQVIQVIQLSGFNMRVWDWDQSAVSSPLFGWEKLHWLHSVSSWGVVLFLFPGLWLVRKTFRNRENRRQYAKVWDVISFWPRRYHPLAAPCYAERAVPEFRHRIKQLIEGGHKVVISAHSQGTVIAFAALMQMHGEHATYAAALDKLDEDRTDATIQERSQSAADGPPPATIDPQDLRNVAFVTFGCPLTTLYSYYFPAHFGQDKRFGTLRKRLMRLGHGYAWHNFYRPTDYIGREVFTGPAGALEGAGMYGADTRLCEARKARFPIKAHSHYEYEDKVNEHLSRVIAASAPPTRAEAPPRILRAAPDQSRVWIWIQGRNRDPRRQRRRRFQRRRSKTR